MPSYSLKIDPQSDLHKKLLSRLSSRFKLAQGARMREREDAWADAEETILAYVPETDAELVRKNERRMGTPKYTTLMIPYSYAMLMSAHTYWTSVFFARNPVHQFTGRHGEGEMQIQAVEALMSYQVEVGQMMAPYYIWLYDSGKYGHGVLGQYWCAEKIAYGSIVEIEGEMYQTTQEVDGYQGNRVYNCSPYDFWHDPRVPMTFFQRGEFCIARKRLSWADILARVRQGYFINDQLIKDHIGSDKGATEGSGQLVRPDFAQHQFEDFDGTRKETTKHPSGCSFLEFYINLIPSEWGIGPSDRSQIWCITMTEDQGLIVGCSPLGYIHGQFPFDILEPEIEGYGIFNRGIPEVIDGIQRTMDWLLNTHFFNVRTSLNNQFIVDPSKLVVKDVQNSGPGFIWRLRPEAYGTDINKMFAQVPVQDVTRGHVGDLQTMLGIGERTLGVNDQIMGVLSGTGRKTATEVRTSTGFGVNRMKTITEYMSAVGFGPHAQKMVQTSQQLYDAKMKLRIVGDAAIDAGQKFFQVGPEDIAGFYDFVPVDGTLPVDRMAQATLWKEIFAGLRNMPPQIIASYDWAKMFGWMATLGGLKNIHQFKIKVVPDEVAQQQAQQGNVIPLPQAGGSPALMPPPQRQLPPRAGTPGYSGGGSNSSAGLNSILPTG